MKRKCYDSSLVIVDQLTINWRVQTQALLLTLPPGMKWWTRMLQHSVGRNCIGWFNLAAVTGVESRKLTRFIFPTIDIQFIRLILSAIRKPFCNTNQAHQACFSYSYTEPNKLFFMWYTSNLQPQGNNKVTIEGHALNSTATLPMCLQRSRNCHSFLLSQKSGWIS